jgi:predicted ATPase
MLDTIRAYALEKLLEAGERETLERLHSAADAERIAASSITVGTPRTKGDGNRTG